MYSLEICYYRFGRNAFHRSMHAAYLRCVTLMKLFLFSGLQFPYLWSRMSGFCIYWEFINFQYSIFPRALKWLSFSFANMQQLFIVYLILIQYMNQSLTRKHSVLHVGETGYTADRRAEKPHTGQWESRDEQQREAAIIPEAGGRDVSKTQGSGSPGGR